MRRNISRILVLGALVAVFGLGATTAFAEEAKLEVYEPVELDVCTVLAAAGEPCDPPQPAGIVATGPTSIADIVEVAVTPADLTVLIPVDPGPVLTADIEDEGTAAATTGDGPGEIVVLTPASPPPAAAGDGQASDPASSVTTAEPEPTGTAATAPDRNEAPAAEEPEQADEPAAAAGSPEEATDGSDLEGILLAVAVAGIFAAIGLVALVAGGIRARS